jgi:hypothetical protein
MRWVVIAAILALCGTVQAHADESVTTRFVPLGQGEPGVLYENVRASDKSATGVFVMHAGADYLTFSACTELALRGYRVLCANNSSSKSGTFDEGILDKVMLEVGKGVEYLRHYPGIKRVVLFGHSGGATTMTAYQAIAENGLRFCQASSLVHKCPESLGHLSAADGVVLADANWGQATMVLLSIDPSVINEDEGMHNDPSLDMYNPRNGYRPEGSHYSPDFIARFLKAEGERNNRLISAAAQRLGAIDSGKGRFSDDEPYIIPGAFLAANRLFSQDTRLLSHTQHPWTLYKANGSTVTEIVHSVRVPEQHMHFSTQEMKGALKTTVHNFLGSYAIRVTGEFGYDEDSIHGVDWNSTYSNPVGNVESIAVPLLTLGMTGHWEGLAAEAIYEHAKSPDKSIGFIEGADHLYRPCHECEKTPGQFGDTLALTYDVIDRWLSAPTRFRVASKGG